MTEIPTARGDSIDSSQLGLTLITECVVGPRSLEREWNWPTHSFAEVDVEERIASSVAQLEKAKDHGVDTVVDRVIAGVGRDIHLLKRIAEQTRVNIIGCTGWYTIDEMPAWAYYKNRQAFPEIKDDTEPTLADLFVHDIEVGSLDTGVRSGLIKFTSDSLGITEGVRYAAEAAAEAHRRTGAPITTHTGLGFGVVHALEQQELLKELGVDLSRINLGHIDVTHPDTPLGEFERVLQEGSSISFDMIALDYMWAGEDPRWPGMHKVPEKRIERVVSLIDKGYIDQIMLSNDNTTFTDCQPMPELPFPTYTRVLLDFIPKLKERGITDEQVHKIMYDNPRRFLETKSKGAY